MKHTAAPLIGLLVLACVHAAAPPDAGLVLPGDFSEGTTLADLEKRFGAENVHVAEPRDGTVMLFPDDPERRATVRFWDEETLQHFSSITVSDPASRWRGKLGVRIGTPLAELRRLNGAEFWHTGFTADGTAQVRDGWNAGALDVAEGDQLYLGVDVAVRDAADVARAQALSGEEPQISSEDPRFAELGDRAVVSAITAWSSLDDEW
jgi:hypothetical protein